MNIPSLAGMVTQIRNSSAEYEELWGLGYAEAQIPRWVMRPGVESKAESIVEVVERVQWAAPKPLESTAIGNWARKNTSTDPTDQANRPTDPPEYPSGFTG
jgi:hypothetical protein